MCDLTITRVGRRPLLGRDRRRGRQARPRVDAPQPARRRQRLAPRPHVGPVLHRRVGAAGAQARAVAVRGRPRRRGVPVHDARATSTSATCRSRALRISYVGELGWEIYAPTEFGAQLWDTLWRAGEPLGAVAVGGAAYDAMRLEKGYRLWGQDIDEEHDPFEAGLGWLVRFKKEADFIGRGGGRGDQGARRRAQAVLHGHRRPGAPARRQGGAARRRPPLGYVTSAGYGATVGESILYGYLPVSHAEVGHAAERVERGRRPSGDGQRRAAVRPRQRADEGRRPHPRPPGLSGPSAAAGVQERHDRRPARAQDGDERRRRDRRSARSPAAGRGARSV